MKAPEIRRILLGEKCYFHPGIPPVFSSRIFAEKSDNFPDLWQGKPPPATMPEQYKYAQHGMRRRDIRVPNPACQFYVANVIANNWQQIRPLLRNSRISESACDISHEDGVRITPHNELIAKRLMAIASHSHILKTDIGQFFPSVYTHSIPWAIHGKPEAKKQQNNPALWGNDLDKALRQCNGRQTSGIPIGPATSHIVAEILMSSIDEQVQNSAAQPLRGYRHVDDYFLCFDSEKEAEGTLAAIEKAAAEYELNINAKKTQILKSVEFVENSWPRKLNAISAYRKKIKSPSNWLTQFASEAFALALQNPQDSVMKYALTILRGLPLQEGDSKLREDNWALYESILIRIMFAYPYTMDRVAEILWNCQKAGYPLDKAKLSDAVSVLIAQHALLGHHSEVAWALWLAKVAGLDITDEAAKCLPKVNSGVCALLALDNIQSGVIKPKVDKSLWCGHLSPEGLRDRFWLLAYEAPRRGWLGSLAHIENDDFFSVLHKQGVSFYDEDNDDADFGDSPYP